MRRLQRSEQRSAIIATMKCALKWSGKLSTSLAKLLSTGNSLKSKIFMMNCADCSVTIFLFKRQIIVPPSMILRKMQPWDFSHPCCSFTMTTCAVSVECCNAVCLYFQPTSGEVDARLDCAIREWVSSVRNSACRHWGAYARADSGRGATDAAR